MDHKQADVIDYASNESRARRTDLSGVTDRIGYFLARGGTPEGSGGSVFGIMCERAENYAHASVRCRACSKVEVNGERVPNPFPGFTLDGRDCRCCGGTAYMKPTRADMVSSSPCFQCNRKDDGSKDPDCGACRGLGRIWRGPPDPMWNTVQCMKCRGTGEVLDEDHQDECPRCAPWGSRGYTVPLTVRSTGSSVNRRAPARESGGSETGSGNAGSFSTLGLRGHEDHEPGESIDETTLSEFGKMSRIIEALRQVDGRFADAIVAYFGPAGDKYGPTKWGREFVLRLLTKPGAMLIEDALEVARVRGQGHLLDPLEVLVAEHEAEAGAEVPNLRRRALIGQATKAALNLRELSHRALRQVAGEGR